MAKLEQQSDESLKRSQDLNKPEAQLLAEHNGPIAAIGVKGDNLREEFIQALSGLSDLYTKSISNIGTLEEALIYAITTGHKASSNVLHLLDNLIEFRESTPADAVEVNFDIPIEEYGIVVEGAGMDGGIAKGDQAYTILDSPNYREKFTDELYELDAFLSMRLYELRQVQSASGNIMYALMESLSTHDEESICKMSNQVKKILKEISCEHTRHLFQLKHSPKYADLLASKLKHMLKAVEKFVTLNKF
ncbi:CDK5RAP3-like protein [Eumeta japonica]|uniref:CDK5RAP3-like protein n=1 Tax=Eumeta variegata TaxID=151549 RepID=A0A4C1TBI8_EUMVA|nr:CDK5RAP3-like protein [Eumeta japonica]